MRREDKLTSAIDDMTMVMADLAKEVRDMKQQNSGQAQPQQPPRVYMMQGNTIKPVEEIISGVAYRDLTDSPRPDKVLSSENLLASTNAISSTDLNGAFTAMVVSQHGEGGGVGTVFFGSDDMYKITNDGSIKPFHPDMPVVVGPMKRPTGIYVPFTLSTAGQRMISDLGYILYDRAPNEQVHQLAPAFPTVVEYFVNQMEE